MIREKPIVRIRQLCKWHESSMVLEAVDVDIHSSSFVGIVASDQKSETFLMLIIGQHLHFDLGLVLLDGLQINRIKAEERSRLKRSFALAQPFYPATIDTTVLDHVLDRHPIQSMFLGRKVHLVELASYHMHALKLTHLFDKRVNRLNSTERMMISIVKVLMRKPKLVMIDRVWFKLNDEYWLCLMHHLAHLVENDELTVIVNHWDVSTLPYLQRILAFDQGKLVQDTVVDKVDWTLIQILQTKKQMYESTEMHHGRLFKSPLV